MLTLVHTLAAWARLARPVPARGRRAARLRRGLPQGAPDAGGGPRGGDVRAPARRRDRGADDRDRPAGDRGQPRRARDRDGQPRDRRDPRRGDPAARGQPQPAGRERARAPAGGDHGQLAVDEHRPRRRRRCSRAGSRGSSSTSWTCSTGACSPTSWTGSSCIRPTRSAPPTPPATSSARRPRRTSRRARSSTWSACRPS